MVFVVLAACIAARAQVTLISYNFTDQSSQAATLTASFVASNLTAGSFSVSDGAFTSTNFTTGSPPNTPAIGESGGWTDTSPTKFFSFTVTPASGFQVTITNISFEYRQTAAGAANYRVDIGSNANLASGGLIQDSAWHSVSSSITMSAINSAQTVKIFGYNGGLGSFAIDTVTLTGVVSAVPEPSTYAAIFGALTLIGVALHKRRLKRST